jgi:hypothetical protein
VEKETPQYGILFLNFPKTAQSKKSPDGRKFAQSGHPLHKQTFFLPFIQTFSIVGEQCAGGSDRGCQIFLGTIYPNGENIPHDHKIYQSAIKYTKWS